MLIIFAGLPATGKTTIARELARRLGAVHIRVDTIEQAIRDAGVLQAPLNDIGYRVAYAVAEDNLRLGRIVIADSVNPLQLTRDAWVEVAKRAQVRPVEVEVICSERGQLRRRVETRKADIPGLPLPDWQQVQAREYHPWEREHLVIDTAFQSVADGVAFIRQAMYS